MRAGPFELDLVAALCRESGRHFGGSRHPVDGVGGRRYLAGGEEGDAEDGGPHLCGTILVSYISEKPDSGNHQLALYTRLLATELILKNEKNVREHFVAM